MLVKIGSSSVSVHIEKLKRGQMNGMQRHNERKYGQAGASVEHSNENINRERTHENISLGRTDGSWTKRFDETIEEHYTGKRGVRSDAVTAISLTCQFEGTVTEDEAEQVRLLTEFNEWLQERYPYVISSEIHLDETKPGLHFVLVPLTEDGRLSAKEIFSKTNLKKLQEDSLEFFQGVGHKHGFHRLTEEERLERGGSGRSMEQFQAYEDLKKQYQEASDTLESEYEALVKEHDEKARREALRASQRASKLDLRESKLNDRTEALKQRINEYNSRQTAQNERHKAFNKKSKSIADKVLAFNSERESFDAEKLEFQNEMRERHLALIEREAELRESEEALKVREKSVSYLENKHEEIVNRLDVVGAYLKTIASNQREYHEQLDEIAEAVDEDFVMSLESLNSYYEDSMILLNVKKERGLVL